MHTLWYYGSVLGGWEEKECVCVRACVCTCVCACVPIASCSLLVKTSDICSSLAELHGHVYTLSLARLREGCSQHHGAHHSCSCAKPRNVAVSPVTDLKPRRGVSGMGNPAQSGFTTVFLGLGLAIGNWWLVCAWEHLSLACWWWGIDTLHAFNCSLPDVPFWSPPKWLSVFIYM